MDEVREMLGSELKGMEVGVLKRCDRNMSALSTAEKLVQIGDDGLSVITGDKFKQPGRDDERFGN